VDRTFILSPLAPDESHVVPEHDPLMMKLYPAPSPQLEGVAVRLDVPPSGAAPVRAERTKLRRIAVRLFVCRSF